MFAFDEVAATGRVRADGPRARPGRPPRVVDRAEPDRRRADPGRAAALRHRRRAGDRRGRARHVDGRRAGRDRSTWSGRSPTSASSRASPRCWTASPAFGLLRRARCRSPAARARGCGRSSSDTIAERWDEVVDALDELVATPEVDAGALAVARGGRGARRGGRSRERHRRRGGDDAEIEDDDDADAEAARRGSGRRSASTRSGSTPPTARASPCAATSTTSRSSSAPTGGSTLFGTERALVRALADPDETIRARPGRRLDVAGGPGGRPGRRAGRDGRGHEHLRPHRHRRRPRRGRRWTSTPSSWSWPWSCWRRRRVGRGRRGRPRRWPSRSRWAGWCRSSSGPNPTRLAPSPPFDAEAAQWGELVAGLEARLRRH